MSLVVKLRRGEGPFWGTLKWLIKKCFHIHLPVNRLTRPFFSFLYTLHVTARSGKDHLLRFFWYEPLFRSRCVSVGEGFRMEMMPYLNGEGRIIIGDHVYFGGQPNFFFGNRADTRPELIIGDHSFLGHHCSLAVSSSLRIGKHCLIAGGVHISDYDGHPIDADRRRAGEPAPADAIHPIVIGDDVWVGNEATILKGVHIGDRSIVGAGAVVTRDVPPDVVVAGNPARIVKRLRDEEPARHEGQEKKPEIELTNHRT